MPDECEDCKRLGEAVERHLSHISELAREQVRAFERKDMSWVERLDHELERAVAVKERSLRTFKEHWRTHQH